MRSNTSQDLQPGQSRDQRQNDPDDSSQQIQGRGGGGSSGSTWEWVIASAGALAILSLIAFFVFQAVDGDRSPVNAVIQRQAVVPVESGYLVPVQLTNLGTQTAHGLEVEGELIDSNGNTIETSETSIDYLPPLSKKEGGLFFTVDPGQHQLQLRPKGYEIP